MSQDPNKKCHPLYRIEPIKPWFIQEGEGDGEAAGAAAAKAESEAAAARAAEAAEKVAAAEAEKKAQSKMSEEEAKLLKDVMKWKEKARTLEATQAELEEKVNQFSAMQGQLDTIKSAIGDVELDDIKTLLEAKKQAETKALEEKGQYDQIVEQMRTEHKTAVTGLSDKLTSATNELDAAKKQIEALTVGRSFSDSQFVRERSVLTPNISLKEFGSYFDFADGEIVAYNKPRGAEGRAPMVDSEGNKQSFDAAIEKLYAAHPDSNSLLKSTQKPGAGSKSGDSSRGSKKQQSTEQLRGIDRISVGLQALN